MTFDYELDLRNYLISKNWKLLEINHVKYNDIILGDHDVVVYKEKDNKVIILEIQCKDEIVSDTFQFGKASNSVSRFGFFTFNSEYMPQFKEVESTEQPCFIDWVYDENMKKMIDRKKGNPLTQLFISSLDTLIQIRDNIHLKKFKTKKVILFPIISYKTMKGAWLLKICPPQKFFDDMKYYILDKYFASIPKGNFPLIVINESTFKETDILLQLENYFDDIKWD